MLPFLPIVFQASPPETKTRSSTLLAILTLVAGSFLAYWPALAGEPLWDDVFLVGSNPFIRSPLFTIEAFRHWLFPDALAVYYRPVQNLSYIADYIVWQGSAFGYHFTNVLLHAGAGILLFLLLEKLFSELSPSQEYSPRYERSAAFGVAAIWVVHPIHNAAVAYIAGRADSLAALFAIGAWLLFLHACTRTGALRFAGFAFAWMAGLLALCSKEIAIVWLVFFSICQFTLGIGKKTPRQPPKTWAFILSLLFLVTSYAILRRLPDPHPGLTTEPEPFLARIILTLRALGDYSELMVFPSNLQMCRAVLQVSAYSTPAAWLQHMRDEYLSLIGIATVAIFWHGIASPVSGREMRRLGALWFATGFLPISNLIPLNAQVAEHWIYMPSIGFLVFVAGWFSPLPAQWRKPAIVLIILAGLAFTARSFIRSEDWTSPERLFSSTIKSGANDPRILLGFASTYAERGEKKRAEEILRKIVAAWPNYPPASIQLGNILIAEGRPSEAEPLLRAAAADANAKLVAGSWAAEVNRAKIQGNQGHWKQALSIVDEALAKYPAVSDLIRCKVQLLQQNGRTEEALALAQDYAIKTWWDPGLQTSLARIYFSCGKQDAAIETLRKTAWLDIWSSEAPSMAAQVELSRHRPEAALPYAKQASWRNPSPKNYMLLAFVLHQLERSSEAEDALKQAKQLER